MTKKIDWINTALRAMSTILIDFAMLIVQFAFSYTFLNTIFNSLYKAITNKNIPFPYNIVDLWDRGMQSNAVQPVEQIQLLILPFFGMLLINVIYYAITHKFLFAPFKIIYSK